MRKLLLLFDKKITYIILAIISYITLCLNNIVPAYNIFSFCLLITLIFLFVKYFKKPTKEYLGLSFFSLIFAFLLVLGNLCIQYMSDRKVSIIMELFTFHSIISFIGYTALFQLFLGNVIPRLCKVKLKEIVYDKKKSKYVFLISFIILILAWLPYFLSLFPGTVSTDSWGELMRASKNQLAFDNHTIAHLLVIRLAYIIGYGLFKSLTAAIATYSIIQILVLASIFSYSLVFLYKHRVNFKILVAILAFYALTPIFGYYSIVMWKDIFFAAFLLLLTIECYKFIENRNNLKISNMISFIIVSIFTIFFRNNAIYMYFVLIIFSFIMLRNNYKKLIVMFAIVLSFYFIIKGPVFDYFSVRTSASSEYIAIPMQQIGRMVYKDVDLTNSEKKTLNKLIDVDLLRDIYNPMSSDNIKFNEEYNKEVFDKNKFDYFKLWLGLVVKHPTIAVESYAVSTLGYWYPNIWDRSYENTIVENTKGVKIEPKAPKFVQDYVANITNQDIPIVALTWSIGLLVWVFFIFAYINYKRNGFKHLYPYIPLFAVWLTIMAATPVYNETRYIFSLFTALPFLLVVPFIKKNSFK